MARRVSYVDAPFEIEALVRETKVQQPKKLLRKGYDTARALEELWNFEEPTKRKTIKQTYEWKSYDAASFTFEQGTSFLVFT